MAGTTKFYTTAIGTGGETRKATGVGGANLMSWGLVVFSVFPMNIHEYDIHTATDWAEKEIAGTMIHREWVGEDDETVTVRGRIFPHHKIGGMPELEFFDRARALAQAHALIRGDGTKLGWFICEELNRGHEYLGPDGIGSQVNFEATFARVPIPDGNDYLTAIREITL